MLRSRPFFKYTDPLTRKKPRNHLKGIPPSSNAQSESLAIETIAFEKARRETSEGFYS
jgi:hypothetical protein